MGEHRRLLDSLLEVSELVERFQGPHGCSETNAFIFHFFLEVVHIVSVRRVRVGFSRQLLYRTLSGPAAAADYSTRVRPEPEV